MREMSTPLNAVKKVLGPKRQLGTELQWIFIAAAAR
jgi:hypothetical protein